MVGQSRLREETDNLHDIEITWEGPFDMDKVINEKRDEGNESNQWDGEDYGLYQIYGEHILGNKEALLYIGKTTKRTFSTRMYEHKRDWLKEESNVKIYLGRIDSHRYTAKNNWRAWEGDVEIAEKILIYKYTPHYNSREITNPPLLKDNKIRLIHSGDIGQINEEDNAPDDY